MCSQLVNRNTALRMGACLDAVTIICIGFITCKFLSEHSSYNSPTFLVEQNRPHSTADFPAISICQSPEKFQISRLATAMRSLVQSGEEKDHQLSAEELSSSTEQLESFVRGLLWPQQAFCLGCNSTVPCEACSHFSTSLHLHQAFLPCSQVLESCEWNGKPVCCCCNFRKLLTSQGVCFTLNSRQTDGSADGNVFMVERRRPEATFTIKSAHQTEVFVHDQEDVSFWETALRKERFMVQKKAANGAPVEATVPRVTRVGERRLVRFA